MPQQEDDENLKNITNKLNTIGCCKLCTLRFIGETTQDKYTEAYHSILTKNPEEHENDCKIQKCNPCVACLGLLQKSLTDELLEKVQKEILAKDYDCESFNIALTLPVSFQLRAHSLWLYMTTTYPDYCTTAFPLNCVTISVKDVWKWVISPCLGERVNKRFDANSDLILTISVSYSDDITESVVLLDVDKKTFGRKRTNTHVDMFSRKTVDTVLQNVDKEIFTKYFSIPPSIPTASISCGSIILQHNSVFFAGRYNKLSRHLSQTPWVIDGERRMEDSIHELISGPIELLSKTNTGTKFLASGREDIDVRTLGRGRPFAIECLDPRRAGFPFDTFREVESEINKNGLGKVAIRDLQIVKKESMDSLKTGEEKKTKEYCALCVVHGPPPKGLDQLARLAPLTITQRTPVRVLHRRPAAARLRTVHHISILPVKSDDPDYSLFKLYVVTQAGTYIKEFVHGDFGRTKPSVGDLLGGISVDILALDVQNVNLDWPEPVEYKNEG